MNANKISINIHQQQKTTKILSKPKSTSHGGGTRKINGTTSSRRSNLMSPVGVDRKMLSPPQNLTFIIHKDNTGYGMKVCMVFFSIFNLFCSSILFSFGFSFRYIAAMAHIYFFLFFFYSCIYIKH